MIESGTEYRARMNRYVAKKESKRIARKNAKWHAKQAKLDRRK